MTPSTPPGRFAENLALWALCAALAAGLTVGLDNLVPSPSWRWLGPLLWCVAAWGIFSTRLLRRYPAWQSGRTEFRAAELVLLIVGLRLFTWTAVEGWPSAAVWRAALDEPWQIISPVWLVYTSSAVLIWQWAVQFTAAFSRLAITAEERAYAEQSWTLRYDPLDVSPVRQDRSDVVEHFQRHWLNGGVVLLIAASLNTFALDDFARDLPWWGVGRLPLPRSLLAALLVYFLLGFYMLGRAQTAALLARWLDDGARPTADLELRLRRQLLWVLLAAAAVAALLPIGSGAPAARVLLAVATAVATAAGFLLQLLLYLFAAAAFWLFGGANAPPAEEPPLTPQPGGEPPDFGPLGPDIVPDSAVGLTVWAIVIVATVAALLVLYSRREDLRESAPVVAWRALWARWLAYWQGAARRTVDAARQLRRALQRPVRSEPPAAPRRRRPRSGLTPREQVRAVYLEALDLARGRGVARRAGQTPAEFLRALQAEWPEAAEDGADLTDAFEQARYAPESTESPDLTAVQRSWRQVRAALKRQRPRSQTAEPSAPSSDTAAAADAADEGADESADQ